MASKKTSKCIEKQPVFNKITQKASKATKGFGQLFEASNNTHSPGPRK